MFRKLDDFVNIWQVESQKTIQLLTHVTDETLDQTIVEDHNTIGWLSWHLGVSVIGLGGLASIPFSINKDQKQIPRTADEIVNTYEIATSEFLSYVKKNWDDEELLKEIDMFGQKIPLGTLLFMIIEHQTHHRGQLTVLMRQAGLKVTGLFGPTKEEQ
ncbi:hypothetical protein BTS2_1451 [Bacillus sp. TS-2]|nr:hypothetical protein BTS2_1451 [Bacillus sp. TS-2]